MQRKTKISGKTFYLCEFCFGLPPKGEMFMSVCPNTYAYVIHGIYTAFDNAMKALDAGNPKLANFFLEKLVQKLLALSGTRLLNAETASELAHELAEKIHDNHLKFSDTAINALSAVASAEPR